MAGFVTRFAPSPTGPLHLGHAYSAILAHDLAQSNSGEFLLRIEDIDKSRFRPEWEAQIFDDLHWLGLTWSRPVMRQSDRMACYARALDKLWHQDWLYSCTCSRRDIEQALAAPQEGVAQTNAPESLVYPGTCRPANPLTTQPKPRPSQTNLRLNLRACLARMAPITPFQFLETGIGPDAQTGVIRFSADDLTRDTGDVVLSRGDLGTSYHLSVVLDDDAQRVTHVTRGNDLFEATRIHVLLQELLGLPTPVYHHHRLIRDGQGNRLAKRDDARALAKFRAEGATPDDIRRLVGL